MSILKRFRRALRRWASRFADAEINRTIILVYSMGKVGSSSVYQSLRARLPYASIFHVHFLSDYWLNERLTNADAYFHGNIEIGKRIRDFIKRHPNRRLKVITLVREPIIRDLSGLFQNWEAHFDKNETDVKILLEKMRDHEHEYSLNWFDTEFSNFLNFDIYSVPFDKEKGYSIYKLDEADVLCIRLEDLNRVAREAIRDLLGLSNFSMRSKNKSEEKDRAALYKQARELFEPDGAKLANIYASKYVTHFYAPGEIRDFYRDWTQKEMATNSK